MRVTAKDIEGWAERRDVQGELPRLIRRLAMQAESITEIDFPAGDSVSRPGWDGEMVSLTESTWIPAGRSFWEVSVEGSPTTKANRDFKKRGTSGLAAFDPPSDVRRESTYIAVTGRRWKNKKKWAKERQAKGDWLRRG